MSGGAPVDPGDDPALRPWTGLHPFQDAMSGARDQALSQLRSLGATMGDGATAVRDKVAAVDLLSSEAIVAALAWLAADDLRPGLQGLQQLQRGTDALSAQFSPHRPAFSPCVPCLGRGPGAERAARIRRRQALAAAGAQLPDPAARAAAARLLADTRAVELARLSDNAYNQFDGQAAAADRAPPAPWRALTPEEAGIDTKLLAAAKAVVYRAPDDFPFEPKTVIAFRGTTLDKDDLVADHDQALGLENAQYEAARLIGGLAAAKWPDAVVTGHSLGGGKAQAAGLAGGLSGELFNSATLHPATMGTTPDALAARGGGFVQYRAAADAGSPVGDPLTGLEMSPSLQSKMYGGAVGLQALGRANAAALDTLGIDALAWVAPEQRDTAQAMATRMLNVTAPEAARNFALSGGRWYLPPMLGEVREVPVRDDQGQTPGLVGHHLIGSMVNGLEARKAGDVGTLLAATQQPGPASEYLGPGR